MEGFGSHDKTVSCSEKAQPHTTPTQAFSGLCSFGFQGRGVDVDLINSH